MAFGEGSQGDGVPAAAGCGTGAPGALRSVMEEGVGLIADVDQAAAGAELIDSRKNRPRNDRAAGVVG